MHDLLIIEKIETFLKEIGIPFAWESISEATFLPGIKIRGGQLVADPEKLKYPGDLLHEAGHIAVVAPSDRTGLSDDVTTHREQTDGDEIAAILWSYAALKHIGISEEVVFHPDGYKGFSNWYIEQLTTQNYIGLPLLEWMQMTAGPQKAKEMNIDPFPKMRQWLRTSN